MREEMGLASIPLTMLLGSKEFCDDESLDVAGFMENMRVYDGKSASAAPTPFLYQEAIESADDSYVVTLSSKLSGSYNNAVIGNDLAVENGSSAAHIFDSKSASAGETLVAIKIHELIQAGKSRCHIIETVTHFIENMKTYFVLENHDNLLKNGRLKKITASLIRLLDIKLIMGSDGNGEIALHEKCRGTKKMVQQLLTFIERGSKDTQNENLVICHCNNQCFAEKIKTLVEERFNFKRIIVVPTGGLSSMYADNEGVILAF
jgi:DegV family protein with EDD domain